MSIQALLESDHRRLEALLDRAGAPGDSFDWVSWDAFRRGLLRHIAMEEKILVPAAHEARGGEPLPVAGPLRLPTSATRSPRSLSHVSRLAAAPAVPVAKHVDGPLVEQALRRALARAGFDFEDDADAPGS